MITVACTILGCSQPQERQQVVKNDSSVSNKPVLATDAKPSENDLEAQLVQAGLVNIRSLDSLCIVDLKYSSTDNFVGVDVYGSLTGCYLQPEVARMLSRAQHELTSRNPGYRLLLFDCARPLSVQQILWDTLQKPEELKHLYVA